ncbi:unnamed protein product, partial [marine sediment metagenome]
SSFEIDEIIEDENSEKEKRIHELSIWTQKVLNMISKDKHGK